MIWPRQKKERIIENVAYWNGPDSFISHSDQILKIDAFDVLNSPTRSVRAFQFFFGYTFFSLGNYCFSFLEFFKVLFLSLWMCFFLLFFPEMMNDYLVFLFALISSYYYYLILVFHFALAFSVRWLLPLLLLLLICVLSFEIIFVLSNLLLFSRRKKNDFFSPQTTTMENRIWKKNK